MPSYVVKSADIGESLRRIEEIVTEGGGRIIAFKREFIPLLQKPENRRIQHFYYCDDREGISVRLFDRPFAEENSDLNFRKSRIIFRAGQVGTDDGPLKSKLVRVWDDYEKPPRGVNTNDEDEADKYFAGRNGGVVQSKKVELTEAMIDDSITQRYATLWRTTYLGSDFFTRFEEALANHR